MSDIKREDLDVYCQCGKTDYPHHRPVSDADLAALGYEKRPTCTGCGGSGSVRGGDWIAQDGSRFGDSANTPQWRTCPKCGGSGYGRLVSLDVDVEALREMSEQWGRFGLSDDNLLLDLARQVLAALDGEEA